MPPTCRSKSYAQPQHCDHNNCRYAASITDSATVSCGKDLSVMTLNSITLKWTEIKLA